MRPYAHGQYLPWPEEGNFPRMGVSLALRLNMQAHLPCYKEWPDFISEVAATPTRVGRPNSPVPYQVLKRRGNVWMLADPGGMTQEGQSYGGPWSALYLEFDPYDQGINLENL